MIMGYGKKTSNVVVKVEDKKVKEHDQQFELKGWEVANKYRKKQPIITFVSDDGYKEDYNLLKDVFVSRGVPCVLAIISEWVGTQYYMTQEQLLELQNEHGYEISSHSKTHEDLTQLTPEEVDEQCRGSHDTLNSLGMKCETICIPYGAYNNDVLDIAKKYYRGIRTSDNGINTDITNFNLKSVTFGDAPIDLNYYKTQVDEAVDSNGWLIFLMHGNKFGEDQTKIDDLAELIDYIQSKNVDVVTLSEGLNRVGNLIESQDFRLNANGLMTGSQANTYYTGVDTHTASSTILDFKANAINITHISTDSSFPRGLPGTLYTYNFRRTSDWSSQYAFQEFHRLDNSDVYRRKCLSDTTWGEWEKIISPTERIYGYTNIPSSHQITDYPLNTIITSPVQTGSASGYPQNAAGTLTIYRSEFNDFSYETYKIYNDNELYIRSWIGGAWTGWELLNDKPSTAQRAADNTFTNSSAITEFPVNAVTYCKVTTANATGLPGDVGGVLITYRFDGFTHAFNWQEYRKYNLNELWRRNCVDATTWGEWEKISAV